MDRLADQSLSAATFTDQALGPLPARASVVIVGGGIVGSSIAYHLAKAGVNDVLLVERNVLTSGTTWHAAGLIAHARGSIALTELAKYGPTLYSTLQDATTIDVGLTQPGSISVARTPGRVDELLYAADVANHCGVRTQILTPENIAQLWPLASTDGMLAGLFFPDDGYVNPGYAAIAMAQMAHDHGVMIRENVTVLEVLADRGMVHGIRTTHGDVAADTVVLACGLWSRDLGATVGAHIPLYAAEHVHVRSHAIPGGVEGLPVLRDVDNSYYIRTELDQLLVGAFEPKGLPRASSEIDATGFAMFDPNWPHFDPIRHKAESTVPALVDAGYDRFINAPESFTPDTNFLLGESAEVQRLFVAAGMNSQGIIYAPGVGRALSSWITSGAPDFDSASVDIQRFSRHQSNRHYLHTRTQESLGRLYGMHWPHYQAVSARGVRRTPLHSSLTERDARFGEINAMERANWFGGVRVEDSYSYGRPRWFEQVASEHRCTREKVSLFDLSAFSKFEIVGADAKALCQRAATANLDVPNGRIVYTLFLNNTGGIELDGTITALSATRFLVVTPSTSHTKALAYLNRVAQDFSAQVVDVTSSLATIGVMGPRSRELMSRVSPADWSNSAQPLYTSREVEIADGFAWVLRLSYVGELGYEIYVPADLAVNVYDALWEAGQDLGVQPAGFFALDSLRLEKGYRHLGHDIGPADNPFTAGLAFAVDLNTEVEFIGANALRAIDRAALSHRVVHIALEDPDVMLVHDETIFVGDLPVGRLTSGGYGHTLGRSVGIGVIERGVALDSQFTLRCKGQMFPITVSTKPFYDPGNHRMLDEEETGSWHVNT
ncbi:MAG: FAD-dependent oxidoreductase [Candidatus Nanopelagicales bacterium]|nr:FAD-dependent oxidoreductase [Candidatus Nanopelagicales bacterium]